MSMLSTSGLGAIGTGIQAKETIDLSTYVCSMHGTLRKHRRPLIVKGPPLIQKTSSNQNLVTLNFEAKKEPVIISLTFFRLAVPNLQFLLIGNMPGT